MELGPRQKTLIEKLKSSTAKRIEGKLAQRYADQTCYCVEGLICEIAIEMGCNVSKYTNLNTVCFDGNLLMMPASVRNFFQIAQESELWVLNDVNGLGFKDVAEIMEKKPGDFFYRSI